MNNAGITMRLLALADALVGHMIGALGADVHACSRPCWAA